MTSFDHQYRGPAYPADPRTGRVNPRATAERITGRRFTVIRHGPAGAIIANALGTTWAVAATHLTNLVRA